MTVPIAVSPGRSGFAPELSLSYNSGSGNGPFGLGWTISLASISRKTDKGLPRYRDTESSDVFLLADAEDLVPALSERADGSWGAYDSPDRTVDGTTYRVQRYRPRTEGAFARIERWTSGATGTIHWRMISRENVTTLFGLTEESRVADPNDPTRVFRWLVSDRYDDKGNAMHFTYVPEDSAGIEASQVHERNRTPTGRSANRYLKRIDYGNRTPHQPGEDLRTRTDWMFEVVLDYDEGVYSVRPNGSESQATVDVQHQPTSPWSVRRDPFSSYRAGFEIRTYRLCRRVLLFHHFEDELGAPDYLVRSTEFNYHEDGVASTLTSVSQCGYRRLEDGSYLRKSMPPVEFEYSEARLSDQVGEVDWESMANLPSGLANRHAHWVDLDGEGASGILMDREESWYYKRNESPAAAPPAEGDEAPPVQFGPMKAVDWRPSYDDLQDGSHQLLDLAGDGQIDLVRLTSSHSGFFERTPAGRWAAYRPFETMPTIAWRDPNLRFVDLTGDGHADVLLTEDDVLTWYPSLGEAGYGEAEEVHKALDDESGPTLVFADGTQSVYIADLSGDGLKDLVRIRNGEVSYWPNMGYGRFGSKVTMDEAPWFDAPDQFDQRRVRLADIDGSGVTDILYIGRDGVQIHLNESGNGWRKSRRLDSLPPVDEPSDITVVDLLGNGTACLVWSSPLPSDEGRAMRYVDLMGGQKPHLLVGMVNNLGAETRVQYAPSTKFYVQDRQAGRPWITRLPFPVHVVERVDVVDHIGRNRFTTRYAYHHGYFDGIEREFRGFGMVEQWDTESVAALTGDDVLPEAENIDASSHVPPVYTKTWFHTGAYRIGQRVSDYFAGLDGASDLGEYYREPGLSDADAQQMLLPDTVLPHGLTAEEERQACRSLKGSKLREEVYALDGSVREPHPYSVTEQNFTVHPVQPTLDNHHAVFFTLARESLSVLYERDPADPRVTHKLTLEVDDFGHVLKSATVGYGRRFDATDPVLDATDHGKQRLIHISSKENTFTNAIDAPDTYRVPQPAVSRTYEVRTPEQERNPGGHTKLYDFDEMTALLTQAADGSHEVAFEDVDFKRAREAADADPTEADRYFRRRIEEVRTLYRKDDLSGALPLGDLEPLALPFESYTLAFTPGLVDDVYGSRVDAAMLRDEGRYVHFAGDANWWMPSGRLFYSPDSGHGPADELAFARQHFFLPHRFADPFDETTTVGYDKQDLTAVRMVDPIGNETAAVLDYRTLRPRLVSGPNGNRSSVAFDALGMVVGTAAMGKASSAEPDGDSLDGFVSDLSDADIRHHLKNPLAGPHTVLGRATTRLIYDLFGYKRTKNQPDVQPAVVYTLARETHEADLESDDQTKVQHSFSYSDGFGREIQKKIQAEPGPLEENGPVVSPRWVGSGWTIFNNKGKPVRQYEPFFSKRERADGTFFSDHRFEFGVEVGVSPVLFYDPVGRVVATLHPNHTYEKVVFDPWRQVTWDVNDTVLDDPRTDPDIQGYTAGYFASPPAPSWNTWHAQRQSGGRGPHEQAAAEKAAAHAGTPTMAYLDSLGRPFLTVSHNKVAAPGHDLDGAEDHVPTRVELDIEGNQRAVRDAIVQSGDAQGRIVMRYAYDMLGSRIHQESMEAGARWMLNDVAGNPIRVWDSRGHAFRTEYDPLRRPLRTVVTGADPADPTAKVLTERLVYGEQHPEAEQRNLRGQLYLHLDQAGAATTEAFDFKGNPLRATRRLATEYKQAIDWGTVDAALPVDAPAHFDPAALEAALGPLLEAETYTSRMTYDALNRPIQLIAPHSEQPETKTNVIQPGYNEANLLEHVNAWMNQDTEPSDVLDPSTADLNAVTNIDYDAKGQRMSIAYGNGAQTIYDYDPETFRLIHLKTTRPPNPDVTASQLFTDPTVVQDLHYTYDPAGNITRIEDAALRTVIHNNRRVEPSRSYIYDALYRLVEARGREHIGQTAFDFNSTDGNYRDYPFRGLRAHPNDSQAMRNYTERYVYDAVGNFLKMQHRSDDPAHSGWTRGYDYNKTSLIESNKVNNRLGQTTVGNGNMRAERYDYDAHGNMTRMPHLPLMRWDYRDQLKEVDLGGGGTVYYVYDAAGQRVRKVHEHSGATLEERHYLGGFEVYRKRRNGMLEVRRETLHLMDDKQRIAVGETKTHADGAALNTPTSVVRYQLGNHLGSASLELDDSAAAKVITYEEYYSFGGTSYQASRSAAETSLKRYRYTGKECDDETGLYYYGARYYAAWLGRWTATDPAGLVDGGNTYRYVSDQPTKKIDPDGRQEYAIVNPETGEAYLGSGPNVRVERNTQKTLDEHVETVGDIESVETKLFYLKINDLISEKDYEKATQQVKYQQKIKEAREKIAAETDPEYLNQEVMVSDGAVVKRKDVSKYKTRKRIETVGPYMQDSVGAVFGLVAMGIGASNENIDRSIVAGGSIGTALTARYARPAPHNFKPYSGKAAKTIYAQSRSHEVRRVASSATPAPKTSPAPKTEKKAKKAEASSSFTVEPAKLPTKVQTKTIKTPNKDTAKHTHSKINPLLKIGIGIAFGAGLYMGLRSGKSK